MKAKKYLILVGLLSIGTILFVSFKFPPAETDIVMIKSIEKPNAAGAQTSIVAVYQNGEIVSKKELDDLNGKSIENNLKIVGDLISQYRAQGYKIESSAGSGGTNSIVFQYILEK